MEEERRIGKGRGKNEEETKSRWRIPWERVPTEEEGIQQIVSCSLSFSFRRRAFQLTLSLYLTFVFFVPLSTLSLFPTISAAPTNVASILVSCPLCSKSVKNGLISSHIDSGCKKFLTSSFNSINTRSSSSNSTSGVFGRMMGTTTSGIEKSNGSK